MSRALRNNARTLAPLSFCWCWDWVRTFCVPVPSNHGPSGKTEAVLRQLRDLPQELSLTFSWEDSRSPAQQVVSSAKPAWECLPVLRYDRSRFSPQSFRSLSPADAPP